jgi:hypothetical protein
VGGTLGTRCSLMQTAPLKFCKKNMKLTTTLSAPSGAPSTTKRATHTLCLIDLIFNSLNPPLT